MTAIVTCTQGDFDYVDEWITYHHDRGVDFFLIAYNGKSEYFHKMPRYDYVRYLDVSTNKNYKVFDNLDRTGKNFSWIQPYTEPNDIYQLPFMQQVLNMAYNIIRYCYQQIDWLIIMDVDEFIDVKSGQNINEFFDKHFPRLNSSYFISMELYNDNNRILKTDGGVSVIERLKGDHNYFVPNANESWYNKIVINLKHNDVINERCPILSPHRCVLAETRFRWSIDEISLMHFFTKSIEEWISKMNPAIDTNYLGRFWGKVIYEFEKNGCELTDEKLRAVPALLNKYKVNYDPAIHEQDPRIRELYKKPTIFEFFIELFYFIHINKKYYE